METLPLNFLVKDSPIAMAVLDTDMRFISHSNLWSAKFHLETQTIIGKSYYDVFPETPSELIRVHKACLSGEKNMNKGHKFIRSNGQIQWLEWSINPWRNHKDEIAGLIVVKDDITAQKREEELLLKAEQVARIGGWELDLITNKVYWTAITREIHEVSEDYEPNLEEGINFYKSGEHRENITNLVTAAMTEGKPWDSELIIVTAKNNELWVRAKGEAEIIDGKCVRLFGTFQEIDKKKKAEIKYQETAERLKVATHGSKIGIFDYEIASNTLVWDDSMYRLYGVQKKDFSGEFEAWQSGLHPDDKEKSEKEVEMAISGAKEFNTEFRIIWPNGEIRHIRAIAVTQRNEKNEAIKMVGTNWDITELKNTKLRLEKTEESLQGSFESSFIGMALVGLDGKWTKINDSLSKSIGYKEEELIKLTFQDITHPDDLNKDMGLLEELVRGERESYQLEKRYFHKDGHIVFALLTVTGVKDITGNISHFIAQIVDLSIQKEIENKLTKLLKISKEQNNSLMNFAHIVSHNLRSHSTNMGMLAGFLAVEKNEDECKNLIKMLEEASISLNETVMHLNDVVNVQASAHENMGKVNLYDTIKGVKKNISLLLKENKARCTVNVSENQTVRAIPAYIDSILLNLFTNSLKYSDPERPVCIEITTHEADGMVLVAFKDNGLGIDLEKHGEKLFGMYKTFHKHKEAKGIGLFITKNQIEAMNGKIDLESTVGVGTTFKLYFEKY